MNFFNPCLNFRQLARLFPILAVLCPVLALADPPINDEAIVTPLEMRSAMYEKFKDKHKAKFKASRRRVEFWLSQEQYARDYGLEDTGAVYLPGRDEKERFFRRNYLRFLKKDVERSGRESLENTWDNLMANEEIDAIQERDELLGLEEEDPDEKADLETRIKVGDERMKFRLKPRLHQGAVKINFLWNDFNMQAYLGVNGKQEVKFDRLFKLTKTRALLNYYIDETRMLASLDQELPHNLSFRFIHQKDLDNFDRFFNQGVTETNSFQLRFNMGF